jgi:hypothetical protein
MKIFIMNKKVDIFYQKTWFCNGTVILRCLNILVRCTENGDYK